MLKVTKEDVLEGASSSLSMYGRYGAPVSKGKKGDEATFDPDAPPREDDPSWLGDVAAAPFRGLAGAAEEILELPNVIGLDYDLPDNLGLGKSKTPIGGVISGITSFAAGFIPALGIAGKLGKASKAGKLGKTAKKAESALKGRPRSAAKWATAGVMADFAVFDGHEARLSDLIQQYPSLANPVNEYLASDMDDSELEGRLKNAVEGAAIGGIFDLLGASLRYIRKGRELRAKGASPEEVAEGITKEQEQLEFAFEGFQKKTTKAPEAPKAPKAPKEVAILKTLAARGTKRDTTGGITKVIDDLEKGDAEEVVEELLTKFEKDGVLINPNAFTEGSQVSGEALALIKGVYEGILKTKQDFLLEPSKRTAMVDELKGFGFDMEAGLFEGLAQQHKFDAKLVAAHITLRNHTRELTKNLVEYVSLRDQLAKATGAAASPTIAAKMNLAKLKFLQHQEQVSVLGAAIGAVRSQRGRDLVNLRWMDQANFNKTDEVAELLNGKVDLENMTAEELKAVMDKASAVTEKHGAAGLAKLGAGKGKGLIDLHNELWINALLSGPRTTMINLIGNALTAVYLPLEKALGAQVGYWRTGDARYQTARKELLKVSFFLDSLRESLDLGVRAFREGDTIIQKRAAVTAELKGNAITSENLKSAGGMQEHLADYFGTGVDKAGNVIRIPTRLLTGTDEFFKQIQFRYMAKVEAAVKAHDQLLKKYKDAPIPPKELASLTADLLEGVIRSGGERYSQGAIRRDAWNTLKQAMDENPDQQFDALTQQGFMRDYINKNYDKTKGAISDSAFRASQEATFTLPQEGGFGKWIQDGVSKMPALRLVMPFVSTPVNILKFFGQRTFAVDVPISRSIHKRYMAELASNDPMVKAAAQGRMAAGIGLWATAYGLVSTGKITGHGPERESERKIKQQTGWQPYSIQDPITGAYISYQRLDPFATFLGMAADLAEYAESTDHEDETLLESVIPALLMGLSQNVVNKSYMTGIQQVLEATTSPQRFLPTFLRTRASSYVPAVLGQAAGTLDGDDGIREARTMLEAMKKKVPGAGTLDPRRNVLGEKVTRATTGIGLLDYVSPIMVSSKKKDAVFDEMAKAQHAFSMPSRKIKGGIDLAEHTNSKGQSAYDRMLELQTTVKLNGRTLRQQLNKLLQSSQFKRLSSEPQADMRVPRADAIKRVISKYRRTAKQKMLKEFPTIKEELTLVERIEHGNAMGRDTQSLIDQLKGLR